MPLQIIIDTREQTPWGFPDDEVTAVRGTLSAGDYALAGDDKFAIERKSLDDFLGTISTGWERFNRELDRMDEAGHIAKVMIIEADFIECCFQEKDGKLISPQHNHPGIKPSFVVARIADLTLRGVSVLFANNHILASGMAITIFRHRQRQLEIEKAINQNERNSNDNGGSPLCGETEA
ncbi:MAG: hypothetical protein A2020_12325 [Lentisphaerae bacterium GWF2_45_14]|nr:MAG: hypothetical protein A2020_12325 [Lentisphaerae bacterium GWF2_45_14]